jgi:hypothetical protein
MEQINTITIFAPRFHDMKVLVKPWRIQDGVNKIIFTKTWQDKVLLMEGEKMKTYPMEGHGETGVYAIPVNDFDKQDLGQRSLL